MALAPLAFARGESIMPEDTPIITNTCRTGDEAMTCFGLYQLMYCRGKHSRLNDAALVSCARRPFQGGSHDRYIQLY